MDTHAKLRLIASKLEADDYDVRHQLLDVADDFVRTAAECGKLPSALRTELDEILAEIDAIRPQYPSHRETSLLFDRAGLGQEGRRRAWILGQRIVGWIGAVGRF